MNLDGEVTMMMIVLNAMAIGMSPINQLITP